jgi:hypothetical protein
MSSTNSALPNQPNDKTQKTFRRRNNCIHTNDVVTLNEPNGPCEEFPATSIGSNEVPVHVLGKKPQRTGIQRSREGVGNTAVAIVDIDIKNRN